MPLQYSPKNNPRVIIIQKLYGKFFNNEEILIYPNTDLRNLLRMLLMEQLNVMML